jgi:hypothetical protein
VPVITVNYNAVRFVKMRLPLKALADFIEDFAFFFLPLGVQLIQPSGDFAGAFGVFHAE